MAQVPTSVSWENNVMSVCLEKGTIFSFLSFPGTVVLCPSSHALCLSSPNVDWVRGMGNVYTGERDSYLLELEGERTFGVFLTYSSISLLENKI